MKDIVTYIKESRIAGEVIIKDKSKKINPVMFAYDKESLDEMIDLYKHNETYWKSKQICVAKLNKTHWESNTSDEYALDLIQTNNNNFLTSNKSSYSYDDLLDAFESGKIMIIVINKK